MDTAYSDEDGEFLVRLARNTIEQYLMEGKKLAPPDDTPQHLWNESGVFVTLNSVQGNQKMLRGCIGRPYPTEPLVQATINSAVDSSINDPRFSKVTVEEIGEIVIELSVLTPPVKMEYTNPQDLLNLVKIGRDGLIVSKGIFRGLLLPQVPVEWKWDTQEFLKRTCNKAGLPEDAWLDPMTEFQSFRAEIFGEVNPRGTIVRSPEHRG